MILLFIGPLEQFLNNYLFFKFITKCQKEILRHAPPSYVCDFLFHCLAWKHFTVYIIRETSYIIGQTSLMVRLKTWFCEDYRSQQLLTQSEKYLLLDIRPLWFWNHGMVHAWLYISCLCMYCFLHYTFFIFLISILNVI